MFKRISLGKREHWEREAKTGRELGRKCFLISGVFLPLPQLAPVPPKSVTLSWLPQSILKVCVVLLWSLVKIMFFIDSFISILCYRFKTIVAANLNAITQVCYFLKHLTWDRKPLSTTPLFWVINFWFILTVECLFFRRCDRHLRCWRMT